MKRQFILLFAGALMITMACSACAVKPDKKGAKPGKWTMDLDAAVKVAAKKNLPLLLNFTGSDWCGWCKLMEKNVFSQKEWKKYAKTGVMMILLDYPKDSSLVPEEYVKRNDALKTKYEVEGFPTFILLDDDGTTVLGELGAGQDKTPESFIAELSTLTRYRDAEVAKFLKTLKPESRAEYQAIVDQMSELRTAITGQEDQIRAAQNRVVELTEEAAELQANAQEFRAGQLGGDKLKEYRSLKTELETAQEDFTEWIGTDPDRTEKNMAKYQKMSAYVEELTEKLSQY